MEGNEACDRDPQPAVQATEEQWEEMDRLRLENERFRSLFGSTPEQELSRLSMENARFRALLAAAGVDADLVASAEPRRHLRIENVRLCFSTGGLLRWDNLRTEGIVEWRYPRKLLPYMPENEWENMLLLIDSHLRDVNVLEEKLKALHGNIDHIRTAKWRVEPNNPLTPTVFYVYGQLGPPVESDDVPADTSGPAHWAGAKILEAWDFVQKGVNTRIEQERQRTETTAASTSSGTGMNPSQAAPPPEPPASDQPRAGAGAPHTMD